MYRFENVRRVHLELTSRCNAACPMCARNIRGGRDNPDMPIVELGLEDVRRIFVPDLLRQIEQVWMCGNYGDPMVSRDLIHVLHYFRNVNPALTLGINTNGGAREADWWAELATILDVCQFGIDGLADTNGLYRRNTSFARIMANAAAYIEAGGTADWEFIVFQHNEHQIDEARELARSMGFRHFRTRRTGRFLFKGELLDKVEVLSRSGEKEYEIRPPTRPDLQNAGVAKIASRNDDGASFMSYLESTHIDCKAAADREIFVTAEGLVFPCCYVGHLYPWHKPYEKGQIWRILEKLGGREIVDAKIHGVRKVVEGPLFQQVIPNSWSKPSIEQGRIGVCAGVCGSCKPVQSQYSESEI